MVCCWGREVLGLRSRAVRDEGNGDGDGDGKGEDKR